MATIYLETAFQKEPQEKNAFFFTNFGLTRQTRNEYHDAVLKPGSKAEATVDKALKEQTKENSKLYGKHFRLSNKLAALKVQQQKNAATPSFLGKLRERRLLKSCESLVKSEEKLLNQCWENAAKLDSALFHDRAAQLHTLQAIESGYGCVLNVAPKHPDAQRWLAENGNNIYGVNMRMEVLRRRWAKLPDFDLLPGQPAPELFGAELYKPELVLSPEELAAYERLGEPKDERSDELAAGHEDPLEAEALREDTALFDKDGTSTLASAALSRRPFDFEKNGVSIKRDIRARVADPAAKGEKNKEAQKGAAQRKNDEAPSKR